MKKEYCVISHTHWDREWYFTFEQFRFRLVKLIDNLLDIMEKEENFVFHLDAQTIVLEDYLKIKPQNKFLLEKYIKEVVTGITECLRYIDQSMRVTVI